MTTKGKDLVVPLLSEPSVTGEGGDDDKDLHTSVPTIPATSGGTVATASPGTSPAPPGDSPPLPTSATKERKCACCSGLSILLILNIKQRWPYVFFVSLWTTFMLNRDLTTGSWLYVLATVFAFLIIGEFFLSYFVMALCSRHHLKSRLRLTLFWDLVLESNYQRIYNVLYITISTLLFFAFWVIGHWYPSATDRKAREIVHDMKGAVANISTCPGAAPGMAWNGVPFDIDDDVIANIEEVIAFCLLWLGLVLQSLFYDGPANDRHARLLKEMVVGTKRPPPDPNLTCCMFWDDGVDEILLDLICVLLFVNRAEDVPEYSNYPSLSHYEWKMLKNLDSQQIFALKGFFFDIFDDVDQAWVYERTILRTLMEQRCGRSAWQSFQSVTFVERAVHGLKNRILDRGGALRGVSRESKRQGVRLEDVADLQAGIQALRTVEQFQEADQNDSPNCCCADCCSCCTNYAVTNRCAGVLYLFWIYFRRERQLILMFVSFINLSDWPRLLMFFTALVVEFLVAVVYFLIRYHDMLDNALKVVMARELMRQNRILKMMTVTWVSTWLLVAVGHFIYRLYKHPLDTYEMFKAQSGASGIPTNCNLTEEIRFDFSDTFGLVPEHVIFHAGDLVLDSCHTFWKARFELGFLALVREIYKEIGGTLLLGIFSFLEFFTDALKYKGPSTPRYIRQVKEISKVNFPHVQLNFCDLFILPTDDILQEILILLHFAHDVRQVDSYIKSRAMSNYHFRWLKGLKNEELIYLRQFFFTFWYVRHLERRSYPQTCLWENDMRCCGLCCIVLKCCRHHRGLSVVDGRPRASDRMSVVMLEEESESVVGREEVQMREGGEEGRVQVVVEGED